MFVPITGYDNYSLNEDGVVMRRSNTIMEDALL